MALTHALYRARRAAGTLLLIALCALLVIPALLPAQVALAQGAQRITFPPGGTSANVGTYVTAAQPVLYVLRASAGQQMTVGAGYVNAPYTVSITDARGAGLGQVAAGASWTGILPSTGDYYLTVYAPSTAGGMRVYFNLVISIVSGGPPTPPPPAVERINFAAGAVSATVNGSINAASAKRYVLRAMANQQMTVQTTSTGPFQLTVSGANGQNFGTVNANASLTVQLPLTQDYYISLQSPTDVPTASYTLRVTVVSGGSSPTPTPAPSTQRIQFAPGATSATVYGVTPQTYVLKAMRGQTMIVELYTDAGAPAQAFIATAGGQTLGSATQNYSFSAQLPATQDYYLYVQSPAAGGRVNFTLRVSIY